MVLSNAQRRNFRPTHSIFRFLILTFWLCIRRLTFYTGADLKVYKVSPIKHDFILSRQGECLQSQENQADRSSGSISVPSTALGDVLALALPPPHAQTSSPIFASGGSDGYVYIWDTRARAAAQSFFVSESDISTLKFFNNGYAIVTGADDGVARMFDMRSDCAVASYSLSQNLQQQANSPTRLYNSSPLEYDVTPSNASLTKTSRSANSTYLDNQGIVSLDFSGSGRLMHACYTDYGCVIWDTPVSYTHLDVYKRQA